MKLIKLNIILLILMTTSLRSVPIHPDLLRKVKEGLIDPPFTEQELEYSAKNGYNLPWRSDNLGKRNAAGSVDVDRLWGSPSPPQGQYNSLLLLVEFDGMSHQVDANYFDQLIFAQKEGSLWQYFKVASFGNLDIITLHLPGSIGWLKAPQSVQYYADGKFGWGSYPKNAQKLAEDVILAADSKVDYSQYDNDGDGFVDAIFIVHTGPDGAYTGNKSHIWSHSSALITPKQLDGVKIWRYSMESEYFSKPGDVTIGVFAHELGHVAFGLPDLYDRDGSSQGLGCWSLMATGAWNGKNGHRPALPDAWSRIQMGFAKPISVTANSIGREIRNSEKTPDIFRLWTSGAAGHEYFLLENRFSISPWEYNYYLPGKGLLIYHVDESVARTVNDNEWISGINTNGHYMVALEQADGLYQLENGWPGDWGDPFPGYKKNRSFDNTSYPSSRDYQDSETFVAVKKISDTAEIMTADLYVTHNISYLSIRLFLEGACQSSSDEMRGFLKDVTNSNIAPYPEDKRTLYQMPDRITDWVLLQLRKTESGAPLYSKSVLLRNDGFLVCDDGENKNILIEASPGDYNIIIRHRNHLAAMSAIKISLGSNETAQFDFTTAIEQYNGKNGAKKIAPGVWVFLSGDVNQDGQITTSDFIAWHNAARMNLSGYLAPDLNLDTYITTDDYLIWHNNSRMAASSSVP